MADELTDGEIYALASFGGDKEARDQFVKDMKEAIAEINQPAYSNFTSRTTNYLANLSTDDLTEKTYAIHFQNAPKDGEAGQSFSFIWPFLIVSNYTQDADKQAEKVARILNKYWDEEEFNGPTD